MITSPSITSGLLTIESVHGLRETLVVGPQGITPSMSATSTRDQPFSQSGYPDHVEQGNASVRRSIGPEAVYRDF